MVLHQFGQTDNGVHRRADIVAHVRQKLGFGVVRAFRKNSGLLQFFVDLAVLFQRVFQTPIAAHQLPFCVHQLVVYLLNHVIFVVKQSENAVFRPFLIRRIDRSEIRKIRIAADARQHDQTGLLVGMNHRRQRFSARWKRQFQDALLGCFLRQRVLFQDQIGQKFPFGYSQLGTTLPYFFNFPLLIA